MAATPSVTTLHQHLLAIIDIERVLPATCRYGLVVNHCGVLDCQSCPASSHLHAAVAEIFRCDLPNPGILDMSHPDGYPAMQLISVRARLQRDENDQIRLEEFSGGQHSSGLDDNSSGDASCLHVFTF